MALTGSVVVAATSQNDLCFRWAAQQSIPGNSSTVTWELLLTAGAQGRIIATPGSPWTLELDGHRYTGTTDIAIGNNETKLLASGQVTLAHDNLGQRDFDFAFTQEFYITFGSAYIETVSGSGEAQLDTIPRATVPALASNTAVLGGTLPFTLEGADPGFTHQLWCRFGSETVDMGSFGSGNFSWDIPETLARQIPNSTQGTAQILCATFSGGVQIGAVQAAELVLTVPESMVPTASLSWEDAAGAYAALGVLVQNVSRLTAGTEASGIHGSTITGAQLTLDGGAYNGQVLSAAGDHTLAVTVTDSRGRRAVAQCPISVAAYAVPQLTLAASRCQSDGTPDDTGEFAKITLTGTVTQVNERNTAALTLTYGTETRDIAAAPGAVSAERIVAADSTATLAISAVLSDALASTQKSMTLSTGYATLDLLKGGRGIALGKSATRPGFDCAMKAYFTGGIEGAEPAGAVDAGIRAHSADPEAHSDIRLLYNDVAASIAQKAQLEPEFAGSLADCTDPSKVYVLPDGYLYGYLTTTGPLFTDQIPGAVDSDSTPYNGGAGYRMGWKLNSAGEEIQNEFSTGSLVTGFIPYDPAKVNQIRICGYPGAITSDDWVHFYDASFNWIETPQYLSWFSNYGQTYGPEEAHGGSVNTALFDLAAFTAKSGWYGGQISSRAKYIRVSIQNAVESCAAVTFDQSIAFGTSQGWGSTGHAFVPADHEERIIPLEQTAQDHETRIRDLELLGSGSESASEIPAYIKTEAEAVMDTLLEKQGDRSFTLAALSDFHYGGIGDNKDNLVRACKALSYIQGRIHLDAVATLGDNLPFGQGTDEDMLRAHRYCKEINEILAITRAEGTVMLRTPGNHDRLGGDDENGNPTDFLPDSAVYRYISGYNRMLDFVDVPGGWGYRDFPGHRLRLVVLNTSECQGQGRFSQFNGYHISAKQYRFLVDALDLSAKADADQWSILLLSHHRPDDWQNHIAQSQWGENGYLLPNILQAYRTGGSFTGTLSTGEVITCDYAGKNGAYLLGCIHGHHHDFRYSRLYLGDPAESVLTDIMAIGTPTTAFGTGQEHNPDNDGVFYDSVKDTAAETAFCLYSIDLDSRIIRAIPYGNGPYREILC